MRTNMVTCALIALFLSILPSPSAAQSTCPAANPYDTAPDDVALNNCLSAGGTILLDPVSSPGYIIENTLDITVPGTTLRGNGDIAYIYASPNLRFRMLIAYGVDNVTLELLYFDGQKWNRPLVDCGDFEHGKNLMVVGNGFIMGSVLSVNAVCGSGAEVAGSNFDISYSQFNWNGTPQPGPWADGLTVWQCDGGAIYNNQFHDNTDVDLIVGGGSGCTVTGNWISHSSQYAFAGLMIGWFPGADGNHSGGWYASNQITSTLNKLSFGIMVGNHPWTNLESAQVSDAGTVANNTVSGAVYNLTIDGITSGTITGNSLSGNQGSQGYHCNKSGKNYTADHWGSASIQGGSYNRNFDNGGCTN